LIEPLRREPIRRVKSGHGVQVLASQLLVETNVLPALRFVEKDFGFGSEQLFVGLQFRRRKPVESLDDFLSDTCQALFVVEPDKSVFTLSEQTLQKRKPF